MPVRRTLAALGALAGLLAALPAGASAAGFSLGVAAGDVTDSSAILWAHATARGRTELQVSRNRSFRRLDKTRRVTASPTRDNTVQTKVTGLRANTTYFYRWLQGRARSKVGTFRTAPSASANATIRFAWSGDADAQAAPGSRTPFYNRFGDRNFASYRAMRNERNNFNVNLGDTIYSDTEVPGVTAIARTVRQKWAKYRQNLALPNLADLRGSAAFYSHWDDHEFINDFTMAENGRVIYAAGVKAFRDYSPVTYTSRDGLYRSVRWGRNLEVFLLDERSFRSAKASAGGTCNNPQTGEPDLGPTAPQSTRNLFAIIAPSLSQPVSQACKDAINDPRRTMLGARQFARFAQAIGRSTARFKVIMNEVPIQQFYALPYDRWEGYEAERRRLIDRLTQGGIKNVVFLTTDVHATMINTIQFSTLGENGPRVDSGIYDVTTGPVATMSYSKEINQAVGQDTVTGSAGPLVTNVFLKPPPPNGVGMRCANTDAFSYAQVTVTSSRLTIQPKDQNGRALRQTPNLDGSDGGPCSPVVINAQ